jgi:hypothetical protein
MNKSDLLDSIQNGYASFKEFLAEFDVQQMDQPGTVGKWSIKDTVAHIVVHERWMIQWITIRLEGGHPTLQPYAMPDEDLDQLNEQIYQENLSVPLDEIMRDLEITHAQALKLVETSAEEDILDPRRFQLQGGEPLWNAIAANTFEHYEEHALDIRRWQVALRVPVDGDKQI